MNDLTMNGMLIAAIGTLGSVVAYLWKQLTANYSEVKADNKLCEDDRRRLWEQVAVLNAEVENCKEAHRHNDQRIENK